MRPAESGSLQAASAQASAHAAELLKAEYTEALFAGDPLAEVSTPGLPFDTLPLLALVHALADAQVSFLAIAGAFGALECEERG